MVGASVGCGCGCAMRAGGVVGSGVFAGAWGEWHGLSGVSCPLTEVAVAGVACVWCVLPLVWTFGGGGLGAGSGWTESHGLFLELCDHST